MLKISVIEGETKRQLVLEGKLVAPWTGELTSVFHAVIKDIDHRELVVDVRGLTVISSEGEEVLFALMMQGARFRGSDAFTKELLKQLARRARRTSPSNKT
jgi:anti-anti-sigma regulatory factor